MKLKEWISIKADIKELARRQGKSVDEVRASMQVAIDAAWDSADPNVRARQRWLFPEGKPSVEKFVAVLSKELNKIY